MARGEAHPYIDQYGERLVTAMNAALRQAGVETGCVYGNKLSCLDLSSGVLLQVDRDTCAVRRSAAPAELPTVPAA